MIHEASGSIFMFYLAFHDACGLMFNQTSGVHVAVQACLFGGNGCWWEASSIMHLRAANLHIAELITNIPGIIQVGFLSRSFISSLRDSSLAGGMFRGAW